MENYIVSARKYRPETFQTVIGQPSITTTLKNAIRGRQLAHAYLFCGPRGVGKTTCARIFAKTINCFSITENTEACNECESCLSFNSSRSFNIHELDAASNNSVEDIRSLIDQVRIPPQVAKYSIYIIDEVHMLSANAFNAFLKTLEEPPAHAIFILATTEKHKILPTILSRCQIFDFNRIRIEDIAAHLENIARAENIDAESEGLNIIAQKADGAMRDALSIFDQIVSFAVGKISYQNVIDNLNVLDYDYYFRITEAILNGNTASALIIFDEVLDKGFDSHNFINGLSGHLRDLLVCRDEITLELLEVGAGIREKYKEQAKVCSPGFLINCLSLTNQCDLSFRSSKNQRLHVELCLVQLCGLLTTEKKKSEPGSIRLKKGDSVSSPPNPDKPLSRERDIAATSGEAVSASPEPGKPSAGEMPPDPEKRSVPVNSSSADNPSDPETRSVPVNSSATENPSDPETPAVPGTNPAGYNGNSNNTYSIKNVLKGNITAQACDIQQEAPGGDDDDETLAVQEDGEDFTENELMEQWRKFANQIRKKHPRLYNTLMANKPEINSQTSIRFEISNPLQQEALNKIRPELLSHLKRALNSNIDLELCINETLQESRLYLPEDKYEKMLTKNPELARFRQKFNLDFE
jgi:DNA polymerase III subunit gamma/tau